MSYRRGSAGGWTPRLVDTLKRRIASKRIFVDVEGIEAGDDFAKVIEREVSRSSVVLAIISPGWSSIADAQGRRRLEDPKDLVRIEIETALAHSIRLIPVLVGGCPPLVATDLPESVQALAERHAVEISDKRWNYDCNILASELAKLVPFRVWNIRRAVTVGVCALVLLALASIYDDKSTQPPVSRPTNQSRDASQPSLPHPAVPPPSIGIDARAIDAAARARANDAVRRAQSAAGRAAEAGYLPERIGHGVRLRQEPWTPVRCRRG